MRLVSLRLPTAALAFGLLSLLIAGCGSSGAALNEVPEWMTEHPEQENVLFGAGTGMSRTLQTATEKAETRARNDIASSMEVEFRGMTKDFREETGNESISQFTQVQKEVVSQVLHGTRTAEEKIIKEDGKYRAYVLLQMPIGPAADSFLSKLQKNEGLYTRFRASKSYEELRREVERYENRREEAERASDGS